MEYFYNLPAKERIDITKKAIAARSPLMARWAEPPDNWGVWSKRAELAAQWLSEAASVADLGCGAMTLERHLSLHQRYIPVDIVARDQRTAVQNLEDCSLTSVQADACTMLGLIEYIHDPVSLFRRVGSIFPTIIVSYNLSNGYDLKSRLALGWFNNFTDDEFKTLCLDTDLVIQASVPVIGHELLYLLRRRSA